MPSITDFPITARWPALHPDRLQLYSLPTPNGVKVSIMLEEIGLPYEPHLVSFETQDQMSPAFLSLNPNNKIPAILDPDGPGGRPLALFESGAILIYLAEKTGRLLSSDAARRYETIQWLMFQMAGIGPMFGQLGFFHKFAGKDYDDKRPRDRYVTESRRLLAVLERATRRPDVARRRRLLDRRHRDLPVGQQPLRLLRGGGPRRPQRLSGGGSGAAGVRGPARRRARPEDPAASGSGLNDDLRVR